MESALIIDLCGTLICEDTTRGFLRRLPLRNWRRVLRRVGFTRSLAILSRFARRDIARNVLVFVTRGFHQDYLYGQAAAYVQERLARASNFSVRDAITRAQIAGTSVYLATASLDMVASAVVDQLRLDGMVCSRLGYDDRGICNGRFSVDVTGKKWDYLNAEIPSDGLRAPTVYTDNPEDFDLIRNAQRVYFYGDPSQLSGLPPNELTKILFLPAAAGSSRPCD
ncbi:MAG: haloacid dehalogenase-like hydrolase [Acidobacteriia bacterium]|nr:haloacid dehalogenase-like hydrolase [Terriglobia bacterium]